MITRIWIAFFGIWIFFLTGAMASVLGKTWGGPGVVQAVRLYSLLQDKKAKLKQVQATVDQLEQESVRLEGNAAVQRREVRRVLGYTAPDELVFDFEKHERL
jgi:cell division protein FtsB